MKITAIAVVVAVLCREAHSTLLQDTKHNDRKQDHQDALLQNEAKTETTRRNLALATEERAALVAFHSATGGANWNPIVWTDVDNAASDPCDDNWPGVICNADSSSVTGLRFLQGNNLIGELTSNLLDPLSNLRTLDLPGNTGLTGNIAVLADLSGLRTLSLSASDVSGTINALTDLTSLEQLDLAETDVSGTISALADLTSLEQLGLVNTQVTGTVPSSLCGISFVLIDCQDKVCCPPSCISCQSGDRCPGECPAPPDSMAPSTKPSVSVSVAWLFALYITFR